MWLGYWFVVNIGMTMMNKSLFSNFKFPFPEVICLVHMLSTAGGAWSLVSGLNYVRPASVSRDDLVRLFLFSVVFNINIVLSTTSLSLVSVALHQVTRAAVPVSTALIAMVLQGKRFSARVWATLVPITLGVVLATKGDLSYTTTGLVLCILGTLCASLKGVLTNLFMVGSIKLHPLDLLQYMALFSAIQLVAYLVLSGRVWSLHAYLLEHGTTTLATVLLVNGVGAFLLNYVSFTANKKSSPLTMTVAGCVKQMCTILLSILVFQTEVTFLNALGIGISTIGMSLYSYQNYLESQAGTNAPKNKTQGEMPIDEKEIPLSSL